MLAGRVTTNKTVSTIQNVAKYYPSSFTVMLLLRGKASLRNCSILVSWTAIRLVVPCISSSTTKSALRHHLGIPDLVRTHLILQNCFRFRLFMSTENIRTRCIRRCVLRWTSGIRFKPTLSSICGVIGYMVTMGDDPHLLNR